VAPVLTGAERRRRARLRTAELLGADGLLEAFIEGDFQAAVDFARERGLL